MILRPIQQADNFAVATVIRTVMPEFNCVGEGFSITDPEVDNMATAYAAKGAGFFVLETHGGADAGAQEVTKAAIVGCAGFAPLTGSNNTTCELRKMYLLPPFRGQGGGKLLMEACLDGARKAGYTEIYLETVTAMTSAAEVYRKYGFQHLDGPMGNTGHGGCDIYMLKKL